MDDSQLNINPLPPSNEEQTIIRQSKDKLPTLDIPKGEPLYISREELSKVDDAFFAILSDMAQAVGVTAEMRSLMEDAVKRAYIDEINELRRNNRLERDIEWLRVETLNALLMPRYRRSWRSLWLRKIPNEAQVLFDELIGRQTNAYYYQKAIALPPRNPQENGKDEQEEQDYLPYEIQLSKLRDILPRRMRKNKRAAYDELIEGLAASYASKVEEQKRYAAELEELRVQFEQAQERVNEQQELIGELMSESEPVEDEAENAETEEKPAEGETETAETEEKPAEDEAQPATECEQAPEETEELAQEAEETSEDGDSGEEEPEETANGESEEGLYYGDLFEGDE